MNHKNNHKTIYLYQKILVLFLIALMFLIAFIDFNFFENAIDETIVTNFMLRFIGGLILMYMLIVFGYSWMFKFKHVGKSFLIMIPAFIISINNFPVIAFLNGRATLSDPMYRVFLFFIECLSTGFFEEIIFRGVLLVFLLKALSHLKNGVLLSIILSSLIFGFIHIFNLFSGASFGDTILQIGYSFLVGMMWAVMFLKTKNLWLTMLLHATFNFFGQVMFYLGNVDYRYDVYTVLITILFALGAAFYSYNLYKQLGNNPLEHA